MPVRLKRKNKECKECLAKVDSFSVTRVTYTENQAFSIAELEQTISFDFFASAHK